MKNELKKKFEQIYGAKKRLLAIQLNGFTHTVFYDSGTKQSRMEVERATSYMSEAEQGNSYQEKAARLFEGIPHYEYQGNAVEFLYIHPDNR